MELINSTTSTNFAPPPYHVGNSDLSLSEHLFSSSFSSARPVIGSSSSDMSMLSHFCHSKAGMESVDQSKINAVVYELSKDSSYFKDQQQKAEKVSQRIEQMKNKVNLIRSSSTHPNYLRKLKLKCQHILDQLEKERDLTRWWVVIDFDMYFAAVEIRDDPSLQGKPVAVGGMSMISTTNYEARAFGVRSAMPGWIAKKLCPSLRFVKPNYSKYTSIANQCREIFSEYDPDYESYSLDEAYIDITACLMKRKEEKSIQVQSQFSFDINNHDQSKYDYDYDWNTAAALVAEEIRGRVFELTKLTTSAGIGPNRLLAKIASGKVMERILNEIGIKHVSDIRGDEFAPLIVEIFSDVTAKWLFSISLGVAKNEHQQEESH